MIMQDQKITIKEEMLITPQVPSVSASPATNNRWENRTVISNIRNCFIEVLHNEIDPCTWIVRRWKKFLWFKKCISSDWFISGPQAFAYANEMKQQFSRH